MICALIIFAAASAFDRLGLHLHLNRFWHRGQWIILLLFSINFSSSSIRYICLNTLWRCNRSIYISLFSTLWCLALLCREWEFSVYDHKYNLLNLYLWFHVFLHLSRKHEHLSKSTACEDLQFLWYCLPTTTARNFWKTAWTSPAILATTTMVWESESCCNTTYTGKNYDFG